MNTHKSPSKRDLPAGEPTGLSPPRKTTMKDNSMEDNEVEDDDGREIQQPDSPPAVSNISRTTRGSAAREALKKKAEKHKNKRTDRKVGTGQEYISGHNKNITKKDRPEEPEGQRKKLHHPKTGGSEDYEAGIEETTDDHPGIEFQNMGRDNSEEAEMDEDNAGELPEEKDQNIDDTQGPGRENSAARKEDDRDNDNSNGEQSNAQRADNMTENERMEENESGDTAAEINSKEKPKDTDDQNDTSPRLGAGIQQDEKISVEKDEDDEEDEDDSVIELGAEPKKLTIEEMSFQILYDRSRGKTTAPTDGTAATSEESETYESIRLFVCTEVTDFVGRAGFHEKFTDNLNEFFKEILKLEPGARMIPWNSKHVNLVKGKSTLPPVQNTYKKYVHFRLKYAFQGKKYVRLNIAFPTKGDISWVLEQIEESSDWWEEDHNYATVSPCQGITPVIIGWLSRSLESMTLSDEFQVILRQLVDDPSLGLVWQAINKNGKSRVALDGTVRDNQQKKQKNGRRVYEKAVKAAHIEVDETNKDRTCARLVQLYNRNPDKSYPLGYSLYFVQDLQFRAMGTLEGRQGYLKAWAHQKNLLSFLYNEVCSIVNIDALVPESIGVGSITFRKFLTDLKVAVTPGVEGDKLFVAITRNSNDGMEFCFTYHALAVNEAEEVTRNLPLLYEFEFGGRQSDFFDYDLRQELTGYTWDKNLRQASSPDGAALFQYGSEMGQDREENDLTMENINPLELVTYKRLQGACDETVFGGVDNSAARAAELKQRAKAAASATSTGAAPPQTVEAKDSETGSADSGSHVSDLTSAVSGATEKTGGTIHTMRSDGSYGTRKSRVRKEVAKAKKKAEKEKRQLEIEKDNEIAELRQKMAAMEAAKTTPPTGGGTPTATILLNKDGATGGKVHHSGQSPKWDPLFDAQRAAREADKEAKRLSQKAKDMERARASRDVTSSEKQNSQDTPVILALPDLPELAAMSIDAQDNLFVPFACSFCQKAPTKHRCATIMVDTEPHYFLEGEARCARAFCTSCSTTLAPGHYDPSARTVTCPYHLLQGAQSDITAGAGPRDKSLSTDALPEEDDAARSTEPDPSSNGVEAL